MIKMAAGIATALLGGIYGAMKLRPVKDKIVFISRESDEPTLDIRMLAEQLKKDHPEYEVTTCCKMIPDGLAGKAGYCFNVLTQMKHLASSRAAILDTYCIPVSLLRHRKELVVIQMWHSVGTMKKFGYSILDAGEGSSRKVAEAMHMHRGYDYILCASENYREHLAEGFGYDPEELEIYPLPRVERLHDKVYENYISREIKNKYPQIDGKKVYLYCPTFRKGDAENDEFQKAVNDLISGFRYEDSVLIIKVHPVQAEELKLEKNEKVIVDKDFSTFDMLFVSDVCISDYSCVVYEAALRSLPLYFYAFDYDGYQMKRGMYMDYENEVPGPVVTDAASLYEAIDRGESKPEDVKAFADKYVQSRSDHETKDIADFVIRCIEERKK